MGQIVLGRRFQPAVLTLIIADLLIAVTLMPGPPWHLAFHEAHGAGRFVDWVLHTGGLLAVICTVLLAWSWWGVSDALLDAGLQLSTLLWLCVAAIGVVNAVPWDRTIFALCFALLAAGSAWLEKGNRHLEPSDGSR